MVRYEFFRKVRKSSLWKKFWRLWYFVWIETNIQQNAFNKWHIITLTREKFEKVSWPQFFSHHAKCFFLKKSSTLRGFWKQAELLFQHMVFIIRQKKNFQDSFLDTAFHSFGCFKYHAFLEVFGSQKFSSLAPLKAGGGGKLVNSWIILARLDGLTRQISSRYLI